MNKITDKIKSTETYKNIKNIYDKKGKKNFILSIVLIGLIAIAALVLIFALYIIISAPEFDKEKLYKKNSTVIYDVNGDELARIGEEDRELISYNDLPQVFIDALIATEDSRFFQHNGLDIARFLKASFQQIIGQDAGGASTITMQLVKNTYTNSVAKGIKGIIRKFTDIYMAVFKIESSYTKEDIFEFYVNTLWLGNDNNLNTAGIYGVEQGSQYYFGKSVSELTLAESSLIVGMYQNATLYNPYRNPEGCKNRQKVVLKLMVDHGYITQEDADIAIAIPIESLLKDQKEKASTNANQAAIDYVLRDVEQKTGVNPYKSSMQIYSTIDSEVQKNVNNVVNTDKYYKFKYFPTDEPKEGHKSVMLDQVGIAITSTDNGSIVALNGGRNYQARGLNRATDIARQPGSTAKVFFSYGPALECLATSTGEYLFDEPYTYTTGQSIYDVDGKYEGMMSMRDALRGSRNIPALQSFQKVAAANGCGNKYITDYVHSFGIDFGPNLYESASIGGLEKGVSPLIQSAAYATYARGGYYIEPYSFTKVIFEDGTTFEYKYTKERVVSEETSYMINNMLTNYESTLKVSGTEIAAKTGTTNVSKDIIESKGYNKDIIPDAWMVSYTTEYSIALWYGMDELNKDYFITTSGFGGSNGWNGRVKLMRGLANNIFSTNKTFKKPSGVIEVEVEKNTMPLQLPSASTPSDMRTTALFKEGTEPTEVSIRYQKLNNPTNASYTTKDNLVTLSWDTISTPKAIDKIYLQNYFNSNYGQFASKYYEQRITENETQFGEFGYRIYSEDDAGTLHEISWVSTNSFTTQIEPNTYYKFIIKSSYKNLTSNESDGVEITVGEKIEPGIEL